MGKSSVDREAVKQALQGVMADPISKHLVPSITGSKRVDALIRKAAKTITTTGLTSHPPVADKLMASVDPEVRKTRDEYIAMFANYRAYLSVHTERLMRLIVVCEKIGELDFMDRTGVGSAALKSRKRVDKDLVRANELLTRLLTLEVEVMLVQDQAGLVPFTEFNVRVQSYVTDSQNGAIEVADNFENAVQFEAVKALMIEDPPGVTNAVSAAFYILQQGSNAIAFGGDIAGMVPDPYAQAAAVAMKNAARALNIALAVGKRQAKALANGVAVERYRERHDMQEVWRKHDKDPALMAKMLAEKRKADIDLVLVIADNLIGPATDLLPPLAIAWNGARRLVQSTCNAFVDQRVINLQKEIGTYEGDNVILHVAETFGQALWDDIKGNVFDVLNPLNLIGGAIVSGVGTTIAEAIMAGLPIDAAQPVTGAAMQARLEALGETLIARAPKKDEAFEARMAAAAAAKAPPTADKDGNAVEMVLSDILVDDGGRSYRLAKVGGSSGKLFLETLEFEADKIDAVGALIQSSLPAADAKGRRVEQVDLEVGFAVGHPAPEGMTTVGNHMWVRIGHLWGYIDTAGDHKFWPADVDPAGFEDWSGRRIVKGAYLEGDEKVEGKWYQPFEAHEGYFLFLDSAGNQHWAKGQDNTGNGKGSKFVVKSLAKDAKRYDPTEL